MKAIGVATVALLAAFGAAVGAACASSPPTAAPSAALGTSAPSAAPGTPLPMPGPERGRLGAAVKENAECVRCHADVAAEWSASLHHTSDTEPAYRVSFDIEPLPFCRSCHAPEAIADRDEPDDVRELGVGCVTCHVTEPGAVLAAPRAAGASMGSPLGPYERAPHRVIRDARFASGGACAGCHEFAFPGREVRSVEDLMQGTMAEHAASSRREQACADCHMPAASSGSAPPRRSHRFTTSRDAEQVRRAVEIRAERVDDTHVLVSLLPDQLGHAFPTGDLFRRVEISAWVADDPSNKAVRFLARHFGAEAAGMGRKLLSDDRVRDGGAKILLELGAASAGKPVAWSVRYQRVAHPNGIDERDATLEGELELASGTLSR
ncbi:MAG: multiheme c-type cytochrome [Polyangiaceae bacterium]